MNLQNEATAVVYTNIDIFTITDVAFTIIMALSVALTVLRKQLSENNQPLFKAEAFGPVTSL